MMNLIARDKYTSDTFPWM